jgi:succinyl-CoA synthetase alpha subunit
MVLGTIVKRNTYWDSGSLMAISNRLESLEGIRKVGAVMGTEQNKGLLQEAGLLTDEAKSASPNDLIIVIEAESEEAARSGLRAAEELLRERRPIAEGRRMGPRSLEGALAQSPGANLALISVPGSYAKLEAMKALRRGLHVLLFSDNVPLEDEVELKGFAREKGLLLMGPGCGTAIINGVGLAFANSVRRGPIGIVGAAGTGIQEVTTLIHRSGSGITHAIGTGGRDLWREVGGITMLMGMGALEEDPETEVIVLISKLPHPDVERELASAIEDIEKPVVVDFIGGNPTFVRKAGGIPASTLEEAALRAVSIALGKRYTPRAFTMNGEEALSRARSEYKRFSRRQRFIRGLFSGGSLCEEAITILTELIGPIHSNTPMDPELKIPGLKPSKGNACIDMGEEEFTRGRPHPMIDPRQRQERILQEARDPGVGVILFDVVLGYGAHPDPAGALVPFIEEAKAMAERRGRYLSFVASVVGTEGDPQNLSAQVDKLEDAGVLVMPSNAQAARMASLIATRGGARRALKI